MGASNGLLFRDKVVYIVVIVVVVPHRLRGSIYGRVLTNSITFRGNERRVLERVLMVYGRLLYILERTVTTMTRQ